MHSIASSRSARRLFLISIVARLPLVMLSIGLLVHVQHLTGSFAAAGIVTGAYAVSVGVGGPLLGQVVDRRGQTAVLLCSAFVAATLLVVVAALSKGTPLAALVGLATAIGFATPPLGACLRTLLPALLPNPDDARAAYAVEATAVELTWVSGPPLALGVGALWSTGAALGVAGLVLMAGTVAFATHPASRGWRPTHSAPRERGGSLRAAGMRTLVMVLVAVGVLFGAAEVAVTASAHTLGHTTAAGPLLGLWGLGSVAGGLIAARLGGGAHSAAGLTLVLGALTAGHLALVPAGASLPALAVVLVVAGMAIAPTCASVYAMVDAVAPAGTVTEAFAWLAAATAVGSAVGATCAGTLADHAGPSAAFGLAAGAGALAVLIAALRARALDESADSTSATVAFNARPELALA